MRTHPHAATWRMKIVSLREHLIVRIFYVCGLRPGELFTLRVDDIEPALLKIDEALKNTG
jgi:integrase